MVPLGRLHLEGLNTLRTQLAGCGTQTAALAFGGFIPPSTLSGATEEYDGTSWTTLPGTLATARDRATFGPVGTQSSALGFGGRTPAYTAATEEFTGAGATVTKTITVS
jgi:hypothetical protein